MFAKFFQPSSSTSSEPEKAWNVHRLTDTSYYISGKIPDHATFNFDDMLSHKPTLPDTVIMMGKPVLTPRFVAHYLKPYYYTGRVHEAQPLPTNLAPLLEWANSTLLPSIPISGTFNQVLVNYYMNGLHYIGRHSDDERQLVQNSPIFSASFGQERTFRIRKKSDGSVVEDIAVKDGTFILMCGDMQKEFTHEIPKVMGQKGSNLSPRINVTFRMFK